MATEQWTGPMVARTDPPRTGGERDSLDAWIEFHRVTLLNKCGGLTAAQLKERSVPPSTLSLLGIVRHMTDVERWWFRINGAGQDVAASYFTPERPDEDFDDVETADAAANLQAYRDECDAARDAVVGIDLDTVVVAHFPDLDVECDLRWIFVHMIEEYARHNGHADLLRECIDGATGD